MATSSIFHNIVIKDEATAERFVAALEAAEAHPLRRPSPLREGGEIVL